MSDSLYDIARLAARELVYGGDLPGSILEDVEQEAILWVIENPGQVKDCLFPDGAYNTPRLIGRIRRGLRPVLDAERDAVYGGPRPFVSRYDRDTVEAVLPHILDPNSAPPHEDAPEGAYSSIAKSIDVSKFNRWTVMRADVADALKALGEPDRNLLVAHYVAGKTWESVALKVGVPKTTVYRRAQGALDDMLDHLNGDGPEYHPGRRAISNATARAITDRDYGGES